MAFGGTVRVNPLGVAIMTALCLVFLYISLPAKSISSGEKSAEDKSALVSLKRLLAACIEAAERGGREVRQIREGVSELARQT